MPVENAAGQHDDANANAGDALGSHGDEFSKALQQSEQSATSGAQQAAAASGQQSSPQQAQPQQTPDFLAMAKEVGFTVDQFKSPADFLKALRSEQQELGRFAQVGKQVAPHAHEFNSWLEQQRAAASQQQPVQQQPAAKADDPNSWRKDHFGKQWTVPAWNQNWTAALKSGHIVQDDEGNYVPAPGKEMLVGQLAAQLNEHSSAQQQAMLGLFRDGNPFERMYEAMAPAFQRDMQELVRQQLGEQFQQQTQTTAVEQWEKANASVLYTQDTMGNPVFTPAGAALMDAAEALRSKFPTMEVMEAIELAAARTGFQPASQQQAKTPEQINEEKKSSFMENAAKRAAHAPNSGAHSPTVTPNAPFVVDESELANMFVNAARQ